MYCFEFWQHDCRVYTQCSLNLNIEFTQLLNNNIMWDRCEKGVNMHAVIAAGDNQKVLMKFKLMKRESSHKGHCAMFLRKLLDITRPFSTIIIWYWSYLSGFVAHIGNMNVHGHNVSVMKLNCSFKIPWHMACILHLGGLRKICTLIFKSSVMSSLN